jgi:Fe-Mn family superoxide dismutase
MWVAGLPEGAVAAQAQSSGLVTGTPKPLRHTEIPGFLSAAQIAPHHTAHYGGALTAFKTVEAQYEEALASGTPVDAPRFERLRQLQSSRGNSVLLHELYFDGLGRAASTPEPELRAALARRFGSVERWAADFVASARAAAGWALLVVHPVNGRLYNVVSDEHAQGPMWMSLPLVVIDTYEHAYYIDYQQRKADYIDRFLRHVDWAQAEARYLAGRR